MEDMVVSRVDFISPVDVAGAEKGPVSLRHEARLMGGCMRSQQLCTEETEVALQ